MLLFIKLDLWLTSDFYMWERVTHHKNTRKCISLTERW